MILYILTDYAQSDAQRRTPAADCCNKRSGVVILPFACQVAETFHREYTHILVDEIQVRLLPCLYVANDLTRPRAHAALIQIVHVSKCL